MLVRDGSNGVDIGNVRVRVAERLKVDGLGIGLDGGFYLGQIVCVYKRGGHTELRQRMCQQIVAAAVYGLLGHNVVTLLGKRLNGVGDGSCAGGRSQSGNAAFKRCDALFQHILRGVRQTAVDIAGVSQTEAGGCVGGVVEDIGRGGVNGYGARVGGGIGLLLTNVELQRFKFIVAHKNTSFMFVFLRYC